MAIYYDHLDYNHESNTIREDQHEYWWYDEGWLGTYTDNVRDMDAKGRRVNNQARGMASYNAKITDDDVKAIRSDNRRQIDIAASYGIAQTVVSKIKLYQAWSHVK